MSTQTSKQLLKVDRLMIQAGSNTLCEQLSFDVSAGELWAVLGCNGAGKTTLLHTLAGLAPYHSGRIEFKQTNLSDIPRKQLARELGVMFQDSADPYPATVLQTALTGRHPYLRGWRWESDDDRQYARAMLAQVNLDDLEARQVDTLSGGERRRLALAALLTQDPTLALLDEPLNHLDPHFQIQVLELLRNRVRAQENGVIVSLHDINLAARYCDHILLLDHGQAHSGLTSDILRTELIEQAYGHPVHQLEGPTGPVFIPA